jgi:hypothetical protein
LAVPAACAHAPPALRARTAQVANKSCFITPFLFLSPPLRRSLQHACMRRPGPRDGAICRLGLPCRFACRPLMTSNAHANKMAAAFLEKSKRFQ